MPLCEQPFSETDARLLVLHNEPQLNKQGEDNDKNNTDSPHPLPGRHPNLHQQHQQRDENQVVAGAVAVAVAVTVGCPSDDTFGFDQDELDAIEQLDANANGDVGVEGGEPGPISNGGNISVSVGRGIDVDVDVGRVGGPAGLHGHAAAALPNYIHQQQLPLRHHRLSVADDCDSVELDVAPVASLDFSPQQGDEDTIVAQSSPAASSEEHVAALAFSSTSSSTIPSLALPLPFKVLSNEINDDVVDHEEPDMQSSSYLSSLPLTAVTATTSSSQCKPFSYSRTSSHLPWRVSSPSISSSPMSSGDSLAATVTPIAQPHLRGNPDGTSISEERNTFSASDWRHEQQQQQGSSYTMEQTWAPTSTATSIPSLLSTWDDIPSSRSPYGSHPGSRSSFANAPYNGAPVSLASYATSAAVGVGPPSFGATWPSDYSQPSSYPSSPIRLNDPGFLAEYARYPSHRVISSLHDTMLQPSSSSLPGVLHSYSHTGYYNGPGFRSPSYPTTMDMYQPSRSVALASSPLPLSTSSPRPGFLVPNLTSSDRGASSSVLMRGSDPFTPPTVLSNSLYNPTSMSGLLPPLNMGGINSSGSSNMNYSGFSDHPSSLSSRNPLGHSMIHQHRCMAATAAMGLSMTKQEMQAMDPDPKFCHNCKTTVTPSWRRCPQGRILLCNACGL